MWIIFAPAPRGSGWTTVVTLWPARESSITPQTISDISLPMAMPASSRARTAPTPDM